MSRPKTADLNQNIGTRIMLVHEICLLRYPNFQVSIAANPETARGVTYLTAPGTTAMFVVSTTPPQTPMLAMPPTDR